MAGVFVERQAKVVADNIVTKINRAGEPASYNGHGECFIENGRGARQDSGKVISTRSRPPRSSSTKSDTTRT